MITRHLSVRSPWLPMLGTALLVVLSMLVMGGADRARLAPDVLARSHGSGEGNFSHPASCSANNGNFPCAQVGAACAICTVATYLEVTRNGNPGLETGPATTNCGNNLLGTCNAAFACVANVPNQVLGKCANAPTIISQP